MQPQQQPGGSVRGRRCDPAVTYLAARLCRAPVLAPLSDAPEPPQADAEHGHESQLVVPKLLDHTGSRRRHRRGAPSALPPAAPSARPQPSARSAVASVRTGQLPALRGPPRPLPPAGPPAAEISGALDATIGGEQAAAEWDEGFDRLQRTLGWVVARVERRRQHARPGELAAAWHEVSHWLERFFDDASVMSTTQEIHVALTGAKAAAAAYARPCNATVYCAFAGLEHLLRAAVRAHPGLLQLARDVREELCLAVYTSAPRTVPLEASATVESSDVSSWYQSYQGYRTYFQACRMLSKRIVATQETLVQRGATNEREHFASEYIVKYWQRHLCGVLTRAWRDVIRRRRERSYHRKVLDDLEQLRTELPQVRRDLTLRAVAAEGRARRSEEQCIQLRNDCEDLSEAAVVERKKILDLRQEVADLQDRLRHSGEQHEETTEQRDAQIDQLRTIILDGHRRECGNAFEKEQRAQFADLLERPPGEERGLLLDWINRCATQALADRKIRGAPNKETLIMADFLQGARSVRTYWCVLAFMSPRNVSNDELKRAVLAIDLGVMAKKLNDKAEEIGIVSAVSPKALCDEKTPAEQHELFAAALFSRFSSSATAAYPLLPSTTVLLSEEMLDPAFVDIPTLALRPALTEHSRVATAWAALGRRVCTTVRAGMSELARTGVSAALNEAERADYPLYTEVQTEQVADLFTQEVAPQGMDAEVAEIEEMLRQYFRRMRGVFRAYAGLDGEADLSGDEFWRMAADAQIPDRAFGREALQCIFTRAGACSPRARQNAETPKGEEQGAELLPDSWIASLIRIACVKFSKIPGTVTEKLRTLLDKHILLYCSGTQMDEFKGHIYQAATQDILHRNKQKLKKIFRHYTQPEKPSGGGFVGFFSNSSEVNEMTQEQFTKMVRDINAMDATLNAHSIDAMFKRMLGESNQAKLLYHEFLEAVCGVSVYKYPNPFQPLHNKLSSFLTEWMYPCLSVRLKFKLQAPSGAVSP